MWYLFDFDCKNIYFYKTTKLRNFRVFKYGISEIPCSIPLFSHDMPNPRKGKSRKIPLFPCSVISVSVESIFRGLVSALTVYMLQIMFNIKQHISYATYNLYAK